MILLVANLGSTSFKFALFDMADGERVLARGAADRIGDPPSKWEVTGNGQSADGEADLPDHGAAIDLMLKQVGELGVAAVARIEGIGFKAVHGGPISGAVRVDERVLDTMQQFADVAPAHNPPYIAAMRALAAQRPDVPQVAAFETAFHQTIPMKRQAYAVPYEWITDLGVRRYGFHGASHRYIATRMAELAPEAPKVINCHLGGSSSICAIDHGKSVATSLGLSAQSGLPQSGRVGDFEIFALLKLNAAGISTDEVLRVLGKESGLAGLSGVGADLRQIEAAADEGNERAQLAIDVFIDAIKRYLGAYLAVLDGADAITFTGGIGQNSDRVRRGVLSAMGYAGITLDEQKNEQAGGEAETRIDAPDSRVQLWVLPTNEELIVARQTRDVLAEKVSATPD